MTSVSKEFADNLIANGGWYDGDSENSMGDNPQVIRIWEYENDFGTLSYKCIFANKRERDVYYDGSELRRSKLYADIK